MQSWLQLEVCQHVACIGKLKKARGRVVASIGAAFVAWTQPSLYPYTQAALHTEHYVSMRAATQPQGSAGRYMALHDVLQHPKAHLPSCPPPQYA